MEGPDKKVNTAPRLIATRISVQVAGGCLFLLTMHFFAELTTSYFLGLPREERAGPAVGILFLSSLLVITASLTRFRSQRAFWIVPLPAFVVVGLFAFALGYFMLIGIFYAASTYPPESLPSSRLVGTFPFVFCTNLVLGAMSVLILRLTKATYRVSIWISAGTMFVLPSVFAIFVLYYQTQPS